MTIDRGKRFSNQNSLAGGNFVLFPVIPLSALGDVIVEALRELLDSLFSPIADVISEHTDALIGQIGDVITNNAEALMKLVVKTPHPNAVYSAPTNKAWPQIYEYYWDSIVPLALLLYALSIGLVIFLESTSYLFSTYHRSKLKKRAFTGLLGILAWWWIAALSLQFADALTGYIVPNLSELTLFETLSFTGLSVLGVVLTLFIDLVLFLLLALVYLLREILLYFFVLIMPILIALWVPGVGPFALVARFASRIGGFFVPFLFMTLPVAVLFRLEILLFESLELSMDSLGTWLLALIVPLAALLSPFVLIWQAGAVFLVADRVGRRASVQTARNRVAGAVETKRRTVHRTQNFVGGLQGRGATAYQPPRQRSLGFRANAAGTRLNQVGSRFASELRERRRGPGGSDSGGGGSGGGNHGGEPPRGDGGAPPNTNQQSARQSSTNTGSTHIPVPPATGPPGSDESRSPPGTNSGSESPSGTSGDDSDHIPVPPDRYKRDSNSSTHIPVPPSKTPPWEEGPEFDTLRNDRNRTRRQDSSRRENSSK
jgi:hypothetical protein